jgi:hypothetical protein
MAETQKLLTAFFEPSRSIPLFIVGTAALSLALQAVYDFANEPNEFKGGYWLAIGCLVVAASILSVSAIRQRYTVGQISMKQEKSPRQQMGLILLADAAGENARDAIEYCLPTLKYCWIIAAHDSLESAQALAEQYQDQVSNIYYGELSYLVDPDQLQATYDVVVRIFDLEAVIAGLQPHEIVADISGGTKAMTAGLTLACLARDRDMQFMKRPRDVSGHEKLGADAEPIRIDTTFILSES